MQKLYFGDKYSFIQNKRITASSKLLDIGCRDNILKKYISPHVEYLGIDLFQNNHNGVNIVTNIENGIPCEDKSFDYIVAFDIFEHVNDFQATFSETLKKLKDDGVLIMQIPNMGFLKYRVDYFRNGRFTMTDKYSLKYNTSIDRHRWLTNIFDFKIFLTEYAYNHSLKYDIYSIVSPKIKFLSHILNFFGSSTDLFCKSILVVLQKK